MKDTLIIGGHEFHSRFILGSGKYSLEKMPGVIENSGCQGTQMLSSDAMGSPRNDWKETF